MNNHYINNKKFNFRALKQNAIKKNISSIFELMEYLEDEYGSELDLKAARNYFESCIEELEFIKDGQKEEPKNKIKINNLKLINFRKFSALDVSFEDDVTILIGNNGSGKTTILDALSRTFSYINARMIAKGRNGRPLEPFDVKIGCDDNAYVISSLNLGVNTKYTGSLIKAAKGIENSQTSDLEGYTHLANLYRVINHRSKINHKREINIPLFSFYSVERSLSKSNITFEIEKFDTNSNISRFDVIERSALDGTSNIDDFLKWFIYLDNLDKNNPLQDEIIKLETEVAAFESIASQSELFAEELEKRKIKLTAMKLSLVEMASYEVGKYKYYVKQAIINAVTDVTDIYVDRTSGRVEVKLENKGTHINIFQSSKGQLVYLSLVADLARRLISLNPSLGNPLNGQGIVLIDEIELHLHPEWQQTVINNLKSTFPNIQFIITTHSPQVLSTISKTKIRRLGENVEGEDIVAIPLAESYARSTSEVLNTIMYVSPIPDFVEKDKLNKYRNIIEQGDFRSKEASDLYKELVKALGENHQELVSLSIVKRRREKLG